MFKLSMQESALLLASRSQIVTLKRGHNIKYAPYVFTEHGAVMITTVAQLAKTANADSRRPHVTLEL